MEIFFSVKLENKKRRVSYSFILYSTWDFWDNNESRNETNTWKKKISFRSVSYGKIFILPSWHIDVDKFNLTSLDFFHKVISLPSFRCLVEFYFIFETKDHVHVWFISFVCQIFIEMAIESCSFPILLSLYNYLQTNYFLVECQLSSKDVSLPKDCNY